MFWLTPRFVRRKLLPATYVVFFAGMFVSAASFYQTRPFDVRAAILSNLQSPEVNPHGYGASAAALAITALLLVPATAVFYGRLRRERPSLAVWGMVLCAVGLSAAILVGLLAPFTR